MKFVEYDLELQKKGNEIAIPHTLAEYFFGDVNFLVAKVTEETTQRDILRCPVTLQFASGKRLYFTESSLNLCQKLYPNLSDAVAYGSLVFTNCKSFHEFADANVLVVDHETGENGNLLDNERVKRLVGDCAGKIAPSLAEQIVGDRYTPFQFRLGIKPQRNCSVMRIAKGTLAPHPALAPEGQLADIHLILPTSSFKGRKGDDAIVPGLHRLTLGIGCKQEAYYGRQSLGTQVLVHYPEAVCNELLPYHILPEAALLAEAQQHPLSLAEWYVEQKRATATFLDTDEPDLETESDGGESKRDAAAPAKRERKTEIIAKDASHHGQLLEHPYIADEFKRAVRTKWRDLALGRSIKFRSALAQPSLQLEKDEVCIPILPEGERVMVTRSPLINSNGVIILTNRHLGEFTNQKGVIGIHPETAASQLQGDFDGDRLAFESVNTYPILASEIADALEPKNRYAPVIKMDKIPYRGSLEEIALSAANINIGSYANAIQNFVCLRHQIPGLDDEEKLLWARKIHAIARNTLSTPEKNLPQLNNDEERALFNEQRKLLSNIEKIPQNQVAERQETILAIYERVLFRNVELIQNHLQIAADGPKSALRPSAELLGYCEAVGGAIQGTWIALKKDKTAYLDAPLPAIGNRGVDEMIRAVNKMWQSTAVPVRPSESFRFLFDAPEPEWKERAMPYSEQLKECSREIAVARSLVETYRRTDRPFASLTSAKTERTLYLTNIDPEAIEAFLQKQDKSVALERDSERPGHLWTVTVDNSVRLGRVMPEDMRKYKLTSGTKIEVKEAQVRPAITDLTFDALYQKQQEVGKRIREGCPDSQSLEKMIGALWHLSFPHSSKSEYQYRRGSALFALFADEISARLERNHLREFVLTGVNASESEVPAWHRRVVLLETDILPSQTDDGKFYRAALLNGRVIGAFSATNPAPLPGATFEAYIEVQQPAHVLATTKKGNQLKIGEVRKYQPGRTWQGEEAVMTLRYEHGEKRHSRLMAFLGEATLGAPHRDTLSKLQEAGVDVKKTEGVSFSVKLTSPPANTATLELLSSPEVEEVQSLSMEQKRDYYRDKYLRLLSTVAQMYPQDDQASLDARIGIGLFQHLPSSQWHSLVSTMSQSNTVRSIKSHAQTDEDRARAKAYIESLHQQALNQRQSEEALAR